MGSTVLAIIADNQKPSLNLVRKQKAFGWWEQWVPGADLEPQAVSGGGGNPQATPQPNGTLRLTIDEVGNAAFGRSMVILEGFKGGKVEVSARIDVDDATPIPGGDQVTVALLALPVILGQATFPTVAFPANAIATLILDDTSPTTIQEISAVFEPVAADGDHLAIGIIAAKTLGGVTVVNVDVAGLQVAQILQQTVPRGGNR